MTTMQMADRAAGITGSVIDSSTSLLQAQSHDIVRLAMGSPAPEAIPSATFVELAATVLGAPDGGAFDYGPTEGEASLRESLAAVTAEQGVPEIDPDRLLITAGGMQGLDLACKLFVQRGDLVVTESPTYTNATATITGYEGAILEAPVDADGMVVEALPELVAAAGTVPRVIYVIPNFQNPAGVTLSRPRRELLVDLAERWGSLILEDDPYDLLRFSGTTLPSIEQLAEGRVPVIGVRTFSKILAPGLRVGWLTAEPETITTMIAAKQSMDTCTNVPMQRLVDAFLRAGLLPGHLQDLRSRYRERKAAMLSAIDRELAELGVTTTDPEGGFFLWLTFPQDIDARALFPVALAEGVAYIPGAAFSPGGHFTNALRLCFASSAPARTEEGVRRLRTAIDRFCEGDR